MRFILAAGLLAACCAPLQAQAQGFSPPRMADGHPDLQGVWSANVATTLQRPEGTKTLVVTPEEAKKLVDDYNKQTEKVYDPDFDAPVAAVTQLLSVHGELRSSLIIEPADGQLPLTALGKATQARRKDMRKLGFDNPEERPVGERCVGSVSDPPLVAFSDLIPVQIVQTPASIVAGMEDTHGGRLIDMSGHVPPDAVRSRVGYSAGRWEGDTLVVVTDHLAADDPIGVQWRDDAPVSNASRIIERIQLISADELLYRFTIEDPALYSGPWLAEMVMHRAQGPVYEYACHEGNYAMAHILMAARLGLQKPEPDDKDKAAEKPADKPDAKPTAKPAATQKPAKPSKPN